MARWLNTLGVKLAYGVETTADTKPTTFTAITGVKSIPDLNPEPSTIEVTPLSETEYKQYASGLRDVGGALGFTANLTDDFLDEWNTDIMGAYETAKAANKAMWWEIYHPDLSDSFYFIGTPAELGLSAMEVDAGLETTFYVTPTLIKGFDTPVVPSDPV